MILLEHKTAVITGGAQGLGLAIQPGLIRSAMTEAMSQKAWDLKRAEIAMQRAGEPDEVAGAALFLAAPLSSYMTGTVLEVTGGRFM